MATLSDHINELRRLWEDIPNLAEAVVMQEIEEIERLRNNPDSEIQPTFFSGFEHLHNYSHQCNNADDMTTAFMQWDDNKDKSRAEQILVGIGNIERYLLPAARNLLEEAQKKVAQDKDLSQKGEIPMVRLRDMIGLMETFVNSSAGDELSKLLGKGYKRERSEGFSP